MPEGGGAARLPPSNPRPMVEASERGTRAVCLGRCGTGEIGWDAGPCTTGRDTAAVENRAAARGALGQQDANRAAARGAFCAGRLSGYARVQAAPRSRSKPLQLRMRRQQRLQVRGVSSPSGAASGRAAPRCRHTRACPSSALLTAPPRCRHTRVSEQRPPPSTATLPAHARVRAAPSSQQRLAAPTSTLLQLPTEAAAPPAPPRAGGDPPGPPILRAGGESPQCCPPGGGHDCRLCRLVTAASAGPGPGSGRRLGPDQQP